ELSLEYLALSIGSLVAIGVAARVGIRSLAFYVPMSLAAWFFLLESGVHATLAGVAIGLLAPARAMYDDREYRDKAQRIIDANEAESHQPHPAERLDANALALSAIARESVAPLDRVELALHPWSSFVVVPIFALANAGVRFDGVDVLDAVTDPVALGVSVGLLVGKLIGIMVFTWLAVRLRLGVLPLGVRWAHVIGLSLVAGIGFTVSLFIAGLSFDDAATADLAKTGIFIGSALAGILGYLVLRTMAPARESAADE
ncbi:MAG TPA: Na+/H+ antiporter NhaA, partial [Acidimicrobiia bacterium]|nr:Na+/H+ antiporter NhaA [Acidimicrobiia bacterium]